MKFDCPCVTSCPKRSADCRIACEDWKAWKSNYDAMNEKIRKEKSKAADVNSFLANTRIRVRKGNYRTSLDKKR